MTKRSNDDLSVADTSGLTDGDWAEINRLKRAYDDGGVKAFSEALKELDDNPTLRIRVLGAFFPEMVREAIRDAMAASGTIEEDIRDLIRKLDPPPAKQ